MSGRRLIGALAALALAAGGCGSDDGGGGGGGGRSDALVDFSKKPPFVNALEIDPADESFLLTTNRGFYRIPKDGGEAQRMTAKVTAKEGSSPVGTFLEIDVLGPGELVGSGHPDNPKPLPPYLGFMRSTDGGKTWKVVSRLGEADLHQIRRLHGRLYAFDAVLGAILVSEDEGKTWTERFTPRELILDFVVDPEDPNKILASTEEQIFRSEDGGERWRPADSAPAARLDWPAPDALMRADKDGVFQVSSDGGESWERRSRLDGEPYKVRALDAERAFVALSDGTILETTDGGRSFEERFRP
ncbi:MAG TPA: YCF48-related protein [Solirubrobacteraceae bacterium]|nr:YCF48-related protein [Solirubrobacteraceae bacterium]